jgi:plastocyanin
VSLGTPTGKQPTTKRPHRQRRTGTLALVILFVLALAAMMAAGVAVGQRQERERSGAVPTATSGTGAFAGTATSAPTATSATPTTAPPKARVVKIITKNVGTEANPNRVYLVPGQPGVYHPRIVVRPGERIQIRVDNQDDREHTWTFPGGRLTVQAYEEDPLRPPLTAISTSKPFLAPTKPGTYRFYCRYRKLGMDGALVVRG